MRVRYNGNTGDFMEFDLIRLKNKLDAYISIDAEVTIPKEWIEDTELLDLKDVRVVGDITLDALDEYGISMEVTGTMILPCAVTLKPVEYPFQLKIEGNLEQILQEIDENAKKIENSIDILPIIWENILMEIPMRVVSKEAEEVHLEGDGWKLVTDKDSVKETNPALAKLKDLL